MTRRSFLGVAVGALLASVAVGWLPWVTVGGHGWTLRRVVRDGALLGVLAKPILVAAVLAMVAPLLAAVAALEALRRGRIVPAVVSVTLGGGLLALAGLAGTRVGDGVGPLVAMALGGLALSGAAAGGTRSRRRTGEGAVPWQRGVGGALASGTVITLLGILSFVPLLRRPTHDSPDAAMRAVVAAVERGDVVALAEVTAPEERSVLLDDGLPLVRRLQSLGLVGSVRTLPGADATATALRDVRTDVRPLGDGVASVRIVGARVVPPTPAGELLLVTWWERVRSVVLGAQPAPRSWSEPVSSLRSDPAVPPLLFERHQGHWYLSVVRSLVAASGITDGGATRRTAPAIGAADPAAAVEALADALAAADVDAALRVLAPGEIGAVAGDEVVRRLERLLEPVAREYSLVLPGLESTVRRRGATAWVSVVRTGFDLRTTATDAPPFRVRYDLDTGCTTMRLDVEVTTRCGRDAWNLLADLGLPLGERDVRAVLGRGDGGTRQAFVVVRRDGRWFVSPARTLLRALTVRLAGAGRDEADSALRTLRELAVALRP